MRLAVVTTPAADPAGPLAGLRRLLPELARGAEVSLFVPPQRAGEPFAGLPTRPLDALKPREHDQILYPIANEAEQAFLLPWIRSVGGAVALYDWTLFDLARAAFPELERASWRGAATALREGGVTQARAWWRNRRAQPARALEQERFVLPLNRSVVRFADAFLVTSAHLAEQVRADRNAPVPIGLVRPGAEPAWSDEPRAHERERLGLPPARRDGFLVTSCAAPRAHERLDLLLEAVARARRSRPDVHLALVGAEPTAELRAQPHVLATGALDEDQQRRWLCAGDLGVQLADAATGRGCEGIVRTLAAGRGVIASALAEHQELPAECVYKLHPAEDPAGRLAQKLVELRDAPAVRAALEQSARSFVERECRWPTVAARTLELLERFPCPRAARRSLWAQRREERA